MIDSSWTFPEEPWFDLSYMAVKFAGVRDTSRYVCAVSTAAINDRFGTPDTKQAALQNYHDHAEWVHGLAVRLIEQGMAHPDGFYLITSQVVQDFDRG